MARLYDPNCRWPQLYLPGFYLHHQDWDFDFCWGITLNSKQCQYVCMDVEGYSWGHLVVPYTEELISRPFLDENSIWRLFWDRVDPWPAAGCFFPALCHFCIGFHWIAKSHGAGTVFSGGFVSKTLRWICQGPFFLFAPPTPPSPIVSLWRSE